MRSSCRLKEECAFRNQKGECRVLDSTDFKKRDCPFRKNCQEIRKMAFEEKDPEFKHLYRYYAETCQRKRF